MDPDRARVLRVIVPLVVLVYAAAVLAPLLTRPSPPLYSVVRFAGMLGYVALFLTIVSSEYARELRHIFGRSFIKVHHGLAAAAWLLIISHPVAYALFTKDPGVFVPVWSPLRAFLMWAGRPALYLLALGTLAGFLRKGVKYVHRLNYVGFWLIFAHSWMIGSDLRTTLLRGVWAAMAVVVLVLGLRRMIART